MEITNQLITDIHKITLPDKYFDQNSRMNFDTSKNENSF